MILYPTVDVFLIFPPCNAIENFRRLVQAIHMPLFDSLRIVILALTVPHKPAKAFASSPGHHASIADLANFRKGVGSNGSREAHTAVLVPWRHDRMWLEVAAAWAPRPAKAPKRINKKKRDWIIKRPLASSWLLSPSSLSTLIFLSLLLPSSCLFYYNAQYISLHVTYRIWHPQNLQTYTVCVHKCVGGQSINARSSNAFFPQYLFGACPFCEEPCHVSKSQRSTVLVLWACVCILSILWYTKSGSCIDFPLDWQNPASKVGKWFWVTPRCSERLLRLQSSSCYAEGLSFAFLFFDALPLDVLKSLFHQDPFMNWVEVETARCGGSLPRRLVNMQLLSWLSGVQACEAILSELQHFLKRKRSTKAILWEDSICMSACAIFCNKDGRSKCRRNTVGFWTGCFESANPFHDR